MHIWVIPICKYYVLFLLGLLSSMAMWHTCLILKSHDSCVDCSVLLYYSCFPPKKLREF